MVISSGPYPLVAEVVRAVNAAIPVEDPVVSIGMPVYNGERFIRQALDTLLEQTYPSFEIIISDNASKDGTRRICEEYAAQDHRIKYNRNPTNIGIARNFCRVFDLASGTYFKWSSHDDFLAPKFLECCVAVLNNDPSVVLATTRFNLVDEHGTEKNIDDALDEVATNDGRYRFQTKWPQKLSSWHPHERFLDIVLRNTLCQEFYGLIRADSLRTVSPHGRYSGANKVLVAELSLLGRFYVVDEPLFFSRIHGDHPTNPRSPATALAMDPAWKGRVPFPEMRMFVGYLRAVQKAEVSPVEKALCLAGLARVVFQWRSLAKILLPGPRNALGIGFPGPSRGNH
jgi:hypothetical protein